jgi:hypothetical protein
MGKENDLLADLLDEEIAANEGNDTKPADNEALNALKTQVEELEREKTGLLKAKQAETRKRQESADRLSQLEGAVSTILSQRQRQGIESVTEAEAAGARSQGLQVTYDDDGNGWIDPSAINQITEPFVNRINELEAKLQQSGAEMTAVQKAQKVMEGIIGEDERFGPASGRYRAARKWVEDAVLDFSTSNGINRVMTSGEALDHVFSDAVIQNEFKKQFDGLDLVDVVTAEDSQAHFRRTLNNIAGAMTPETDDLSAPKDKMDSRFQKVLDKPSTLGTNANAKAGQLSILDKVGSLSTEDIENLSNAQIDALMELAGKEGI